MFGALVSICGSRRVSVWDCVHGDEEPVGLTRVFLIVLDNNEALWLRGRRCIRL